MRVIRYIDGHKVKRGDEKMNRKEFEEFCRFVKEKLEEIADRLERLEKVNSELREAETVEVNLSRMNIRLQQARKGVAMRIRFAKYVKPNQKGEYYVILTKEDVRNLMNALQTIKIPQNLSEGNSGNKVSVETVDEALR